MSKDLKPWSIDVSDRAIRYASVPVPNYLFKMIPELAKELTIKSGEEFNSNMVYHNAVQVGIEAIAQSIGYYLTDFELDAMLEKENENTNSQEGTP